VTDFRHCACCSGQLEPAQQLRFLVETDTLDDPDYLAGIRRLPTRRGRPVPVCEGCQRRIEVNPGYTFPARKPASPAVLAAVGILSVGWLIHTLLFGPRV
jgi:hypothetical protein